MTMLMDNRIGWQWTIIRFYLHFKVKCRTVSPQRHIRGRLTVAGARRTPMVESSRVTVGARSLLDYVPICKYVGQNFVFLNTSPVLGTKKMPTDNQYVNPVWRLGQNSDAY